VANATHKVVVDVSPRGRVHELTCRWLTGAFPAGLDATRYKTMAANDKRAAGKRHCSHC
jgi:hypothetical protein